MSHKLFLRTPLVIGLFCGLFWSAHLEAASITVEFKPQEGKPAEYAEVNIYVIGSEVRSREDAITYSSKEKAFSKSFENLEPGRYMLLVFTGTWEEVNDASRPGAFRMQQPVSLAEGGSHEKVVVQYEHLDVEAFKEKMRGDATARGRVTDVAGGPVADMELHVTTMIPSAGDLVVETIRTGADGSFEVPNLSEKGGYTLIDADDNRLGQLRPGQELIVRLQPQVGQTAPNVSFTHLDSGDTVQLSDFKGKVVVVDFWASWCGPCQEPMSKMQAYRDKNPGWGDKVELIALSIDNTRDAAVNHLKKNGWDKSYNAWAGEGGFKADAPTAYGITGIPTAYIIDADGKVAARGHPMSMDIPEMVNGLLARKQE